MSEVAAETAHVVEVYGLPELRDDAALAAITGRAGEKSILYIGDGSRALDMKTGLGAGGLIGGEIDGDCRYIYLPGALTKSLAEGIPAKRLKNAAFVVTDPTKIFIDRLSWRKLRASGLRVFVLSGVTIVAVTVNPYSPAGFRFDGAELVRTVGAAVGDIPVMDIRSGQSARRFA
jgi:hypothetical protein